MIKELLFIQNFFNVEFHFNRCVINTKRMCGMQKNIGVNFMIWDVAGPEKVRELWHHYYEDALGIVWVVDSTNAERFAESKAALETALKDPQLTQDTPVLVVANKSSKPGN